jgi:hypothetical protein
MAIDFEKISRKIKTEVADQEANRDKEDKRLVEEIGVNIKILESYIGPYLSRAITALRMENITAKTRNNYAEKHLAMTETRKWPSISFWCEIPFDKGRFIEKSIPAFFRAFNGHIEIGTGANQLDSEMHVLIGTATPEVIEPLVIKAIEFVLTSYHSIAEVRAKRKNKFIAEYFWEEVSRRRA